MRTHSHATSCQGWAGRGTQQLTGLRVRRPSVPQLPVWPGEVPSRARASFWGCTQGHSLSTCCARLYPQTPCQQELDQVLERISTMRLPDERGPLEHLYSLHIPNCDKNGLYNLKQVGAGLPGLWCALFLPHAPVPL